MAEDSYVPKNSLFCNLRYVLCPKDGGVKSFLIPTLQIWICSILKELFSFERMIFSKMPRAYSENICTKYAIYIFIQEGLKNKFLSDWAINMHAEYSIKNYTYSSLKNEWFFCFLHNI